MARKKNKITIKQKIFAKKFVELKSPMKAALESYNVKNKESASVIGNWALNQPQVQREIERIMDEMDLTDDVLVEKLIEGANANIVSDYKGVAVETEVPDHKTRHKFLESVIDIKGLKAPKQIEQKSISLDIKVEAMSMEQLLKEIKTQTKLLEEAK